MYNSLVVCSHVAADAADRATVETATYVQALSYYCELETDRLRTGPGSSTREPLTDASENAVIGLPRLTEFVSSQLSLVVLGTALGTLMVPGYWSLQMG